MCGSLFFALHSNFAAYFLLSIMLHCTTKRPVWAGNPLPPFPENFKRRTKNRGFLSAFCPSRYNVFIGFSVYGNDFGNDELIHRLTLQQSADVLVQKHGYQ